MEIKYKGNFQTQGHPKIPEKEVEIPTEDEAKKYEAKMKIYEGKSNSWDLLIIILAYIPFRLVRHCDENSHDAWKALILKYEVSDDNKESLNEVTNRWNNCNIKYKILDPYIWFNDL